MSSLKLPDITSLHHYGGDIITYLEEIYNIFRYDFVSNPPHYRGRGEIKLKKHPIVNGKEATFYHITHTGEDEDDREPDLGRMERIAWPKPIIADSRHSDLKVWPNIRRGAGGTKNRINILHEKEKYMVVLDDRKTYVLFWTAFMVDTNHRLKRYLKDYNEHIKTEAAKKT